MLDLLQFITISTYIYTYISYCREAVEILFPMVAEFDAVCTWSSSLIQNLEASFIYRNHMIASTVLYVFNSAHRPYSRDTSIYPAVLSNFQAAIHPSLSKHCSPSDVSYGHNEYYTGQVSGFPRPKLGSYHLMDTNLDLLYSSEREHCGQLDKYAPPTLPSCCTIDSVYESREQPLQRQHVLAANYSNHVITDDEIDYFYIFGGLKHSVPANAAKYMGDVGDVIHIADKAVLRSLEPSRLTHLNFKCGKGREMTRELWNDFPLKARSGLMEKKVRK